MTASPTARLPRRLVDVAALIAVYVIWGSTYYALRIAVDVHAGFPPFLLAGVRFVIAGALLYGYLRLRGMAAPTGQQWVASARIGILLLAVGNGAVCFAERSVSSSLAAVVVATMPLWAAMIARFYGDRQTRLEWLGLYLGFAGVVILNLGGELRAHGLEAIALALAPISWALGSVQSRRLPLPVGPMATAAEMLTGGAVLLVFGALHGERITHLPGDRAVIALAYLIVFGSLVAFSAFTYLLRTARPTVATSYAYVNPLIALGLGVGLGGEHLGAATFAAAAVIVAGVALMTAAKRG